MFSPQPLSANKILGGQAAQAILLPLTRDVSGNPLPSFIMTQAATSQIVNHNAKSVFDNDQAKVSSIGIAGRVPNNLPTVIH